MQHSNRDGFVGFRALLVTTSEVGSMRPRWMRVRNCYSLAYPFRLLALPPPQTSQSMTQAHQPTPPPPPRPLPPRAKAGPGGCATQPTTQYCVVCVVRGTVPSLRASALNLTAALTPTSARLTTPARPGPRPPPHLPGKCTWRAGDHGRHPRGCQPCRRPLLFPAP